FIRRVKMPGSSSAAESGAPLGKASRAAGSSLREIRGGLGYIWARPPVLALLLVKAGWCLGGGILLVLSIFGEKIFPIMGSGAAGIGVLYGARGIGTAFGPIAARWLAGERPAS